MSRELGGVIQMFPIVVDEGEGGRPKRRSGIVETGIVLILRIFPGNVAVGRQALRDQGGKFGFRTIGPGRGGIHSLQTTSYEIYRLNLKVRIIIVVTREIEKQSIVEKLSLEADFVVRQFFRIVGNRSGRVVSAVRKSARLEPLCVSEINHRS